MSSSHGAAPARTGDDGYTGHSGSMVVHHAGGHGSSRRTDCSARCCRESCCGWRSAVTRSTIFERRQPGLVALLHWVPGLALPVALALHIRRGQSVVDARPSATHSHHSSGLCMRDARAPVTERLPSMYRWRALDQLVMMCLGESAHPEKRLSRFNRLAHVEAKPVCRAVGSWASVSPLSGETATGTSLSRGPRLGPIGEIVDQRAAHVSGTASTVWV